MNINTARVRGELAVGDLKDSGPLWAADRQGSDREFPDRIADADEIAMRRLFEEAFRSGPSRRELFIA